MRLVDLTQPWGDRMPTWPQFQSIQVTDITTHHRDGKSTLLVTLNMHTGTHIDAPSHYCETGRDLGQIDINELFGTGLVVDLRPIARRWSFYSLNEVLECLPSGEEIREGDIVVLYNGWDQYNWTKPGRDDVTYFDRHPGPRPEVIEYLIKNRVKWIGTDTASLDHSLCTRVRHLRPDLLREYADLAGQPAEAAIPERLFDHNHYLTARNGVPLLENLGGEIAEVAGRRVQMGAFPWRWRGGEGCVCRVVAFVDD